MANRGKRGATRGKGAKRRQRRKRSSSSVSERSHEPTDSDSDFDKKELMTDSWTYDLEAMRTKPEFNRPETYRVISAKELTVDYAKKSGLTQPLLITDPPSQLGMKMPKGKTFTVANVKKLVGADRRIEVVVVRSQGSQQMTLGEFVDYYEKDPEDRDELLNVLSLEFSQTPLEEKVQSPAVAREIDWVELYWPKELRRAAKNQDPNNEVPLYPKVQHYCLMSVKGCFTDFHIDFGGTSVWYHVLRGKKVFWMVAPTEQNIVMYEEWILKGSQNAAFFGDIVEDCARVELTEGQTFFIPSGWIHAVYTPEDSLVFGGNFLHSSATPMQLRVQKSEEKIRVGKKYRYPFFKEMLWYVVEGVVKHATGRSFLKPISNLPEQSAALPDKVKEGEESEEPAKGSEGTESEESPHVKEECQCISVDNHALAASQLENTPSLSSELADTTAGDADSAVGNVCEKGTEDDDGGRPTEPPHGMFVTPTPQSSDICLVTGASQEHEAERKDDDTKEENMKKDVYEFDEEYLSEMSESERNGYFILLEHLKRTAKFRGGLEVCSRIREPDVLLKAFEEVLQHKAVIDRRKKEHEEEVEKNEETFINVGEPSKREESEASITPTGSASSSLKAPRSRKRKLSQGKDKVTKAAKPKGRKSDIPSHTGPLIVGGLPPAIMPADAPQAPNPYQFDPLASVTALGHKQLPTAYRRVPGMAKAPPTQKFRLHPIRRSACEEESRPEGISKTNEHTSPVESAGVTEESDSNAVVVQKRANESAMSSVAIAHSNTENFHGSGMRGSRETRLPPSVHKLSAPEFEYRSPLARLHSTSLPSSSSRGTPSTSTPKFPRPPKLEINSGNRQDRHPYMEQNRRHNFTSFSDRFRSYRDGSPPRLSGEEKWQMSQRNFTAQNQPPSSSSWPRPSPPPDVRNPPVPSFMPPPYRPPFSVPPTPPSAFARTPPCSVPQFPPPPLPGYPSNPVLPPNWVQPKQPEDSSISTSGEAPPPWKNNNSDNKVCETGNSPSQGNRSVAQPTEKISSNKEESTSDESHQPIKIAFGFPVPARCRQANQQRDPSVTGILKRPPIIQPSAASSPVRQSLLQTSPVMPFPSPPSTSTSTASPPAPQPKIAGFGGVGIGPNDRKREFVLEERAVFSLSDTSATDKSPPKGAPLDYLSTTNELSRIANEVSIETAGDSPHAGQLKKNDSATVLRDPRCSAVSVTPVAHQDSGHDESLNIADAGSTPSSASLKTLQRSDTLFDDLSSLTAEYYDA